MLDKYPVTSLYYYYCTLILQQKRVEDFKTYRQLV